MTGSAVRVVARVLRIGIAIALVGLLVWRSGLLETDARGRVDAAWLLGGLALIPFALALRAFSLGLLLNRDSRVIGFADLMRLTLVGAGIGLIVPMGAADLLKARYGLVMHGSPEKMVVSTVVDKLTSLTAVAAMGIVAAAASGRWALTLVGVLLLSASLVPVLVPSRRVWSTLARLISRGAHGIDESAVMSQARPDAGLLARVYAVSAAGWLVSYLAVYAACRAADAGVGIGTVLALAPVMTIARLVPVSIGGIGVGEATLAALLVSVGVPVATASLASLLQLILLVLAPGAAGLVVLALGRVRRV
ncbi:MAG: lysylphosphatidylglycerol synthase transmembrane domain-containing protein [Coriobacteriia bacterium]